MKVIDEKYLNATSGERTAMLQGVDALITKEPGCCICISTADCIPILLYDRKNQVVAAAHAGWRGTVNYIAGHTLDRMRALYGTDGKDVIACIGPGISLPSFEVGEEVYEAFRMNGFAMDYISEWKPETLSIISTCGLQTGSVARLRCTRRANRNIWHLYLYEHEEFFSARRLGIKSGRILSGIMIVDTKP